MANKKQQKYEDEVSKNRNYAMEQFDKLIIFLSSGAIAFSAGFINNIVVDINNSTKKMSSNNCLVYIRIFFFINISFTKNITNCYG